MGPDRYRVQYPEAPHFLTATVVQWLSLLSRPDNAQILLDALALPSARSATGSMPRSIQCRWDHPLPLRRLPDLPAQRSALIRPSRRARPASTKEGLS